MVAECAAEEWPEDELFELVAAGGAVRRTCRGRTSTRSLELMSEGIRTGRGRRAAYLHHDRSTASCGPGAGPGWPRSPPAAPSRRLGDYRVVAEPDETLVGTVNEDWAIESQAGDVFLLGTTSWRIRQVEPGTVRVVDAHGAPPSVPFWLGEAPARTVELSDEVSELRQQVADRSPSQAASADAGAAGCRWLETGCGIEPSRPSRSCATSRAGLAALGTLPTHGHDRAGAVLRRQRRHAARRARAVRRPDQPRARAWRCASASA